VAHMPTGRRHRCGAEGLVEATGEVVGEELLGSAELAAGLAVWGNNRRRLPPVRWSRGRRRWWNPIAQIR
jgi:hypothetical protein